MDFKIKDFERLIVKCYGLFDPDDYNVDNFKILKPYPEFFPVKDDDIKLFQKEFLNINLLSILQYIAFMYDPNSPLRTAIDNLNRRKLEASKIALFPVLESGKIDQRYEKIIRGQNHLFNRMVIRYIRLARDDDFFTLITYENNLENESFLLGQEEDASKRSAILKNITACKTNITLLKKEMLCDAANLFLNQDLLSIVEDEQLSLTPEDIAIKIRDRIDILNGFNLY